MKKCNLDIKFSRSTLLGVFQQRTSFILELLNLIPFEFWFKGEWPTDNFNPLETIIHLMQTNSYNLLWITDDLGITDGQFKQYRVFSNYVNMNEGEDKAAELRRINLESAQKVAKNYETVERLRSDFVLVRQGVINTLIKKWTLGHSLMELKHPLVKKMKGGAAGIIHRLYIGELDHHGGQVTLMAKLAGFGKFIPMEYCD